MDGGFGRGRCRTQPINATWDFWLPSALEPMDSSSKPLKGFDDSKTTEQVAVGGTAAVISSSLKNREEKLSCKGLAF